MGMRRALSILLRSVSHAAAHQEVLNAFKSQHPDLECVTGRIKLALASTHRGMPSVNGSHTTGGSRRGYELKELPLEWRKTVAALASQKHYVKPLPNVQLVTQVEGKLIWVWRVSGSAWLQGTRVMTLLFPMARLIKRSIRITQARVLQHTVHTGGSIGGMEVSLCLNEGELYVCGFSACVMINVHFKIQDAFKCWWDKGVFRRMERGVHYSLMLDL
eukprot:196601-Pelagomonas_calceolata.AAC.2